MEAISPSAGSRAAAPPRPSWTFLKARRRASIGAQSIKCFLWLPVLWFRLMGRPLRPPCFGPRARTLKPGNLTPALGGQSQVQPGHPLLHPSHPLGLPPPYEPNPHFENYALYRKIKGDFSCPTEFQSFCTHQTEMALRWLIVISNLSNVSWRNLGKIYLRMTKAYY